jgi:hypothetical protein
MKEHNSLNYKIFQFVNFMVQILYFRFNSVEFDTSFKWEALF